MATRARIGMKDQYGEVESIYLHHDGYADHVVPVLKTAYGTPEAVEALLDLGDLSVLDTTLDSCVAFGRDRGEDGVERIHHSADEWPDSSAYFHYEYDPVFRNWHYRRLQDGRWSAWITVV